jgi:UDP-N-acetylmuramyl pentapeptide phosphotransferase/UDP-N-acetylglucosamine-1-phosphate transferase
MPAEAAKPGTMTPQVMRLALVGLFLLVPIWERDHAARLPWLYLVLLAFAVVFCAVPVTRLIALRWRVLDMPAARKVHEVATPLLGGAAVYCGFAVTVLTSFDFSLQLKGVVVGATLVVGIGILDDLTDLPASLKLAGCPGSRG